MDDIYPSAWDLFQLKLKMERTMLNKMRTEKIIQIIKDCCALTEDSVTPKTEIKTLSLDSLSFVELIVNLETEFGIEFEDEQLNIYDYATVQDIINAVEVMTNEILSKR